jgi:hypothetical protein
MRGKILITEDDIAHIKNLYGLINEAIDPKAGGTIELVNHYRPGYYTLNSVDTKTNTLVSDNLRKTLSQINPFLTNNPESIVKTKFISGESIIPNYDNEGRSTLSKKGDSLKPGILSEYRKNEIQNGINTYYNELKKSGLIKDTVEIQPLQYEPRQPSTAIVPEGGWNNYIKWVKDGANPKTNPKYAELKKGYDADQSSTLIITTELKKPTETKIESSGCLSGMEITVWIPKHYCQNAEFFFFANNTLLLNTEGGKTTNLNNSNTTRKVGGVTLTAEQLNPGYGYLYTKKYGTDGNLKGQRYDTFIITNEQSLKITSEGGGFLNLWMVATTGADAHSDIPQVQIKLNGKEIYNQLPKKAYGQLLSLNQCGTEIYTDPAKFPKSTMPNASSLIGELVAERQKIDVKTPVPQVADDKANLLEQTGNVTKMIDDLISQIQSKSTVTEAKKYVQSEEFKRVIATTYRDIYSILTKNNLAKDDNGNYKFDKGNLDVNKRGDMFGDVRERMEEFYNKFKSIYYYNNTWSNNGSPANTMISNLVKNNIINLT